MRKAWVLFAVTLLFLLAGCGQVVKPPQHTNTGTLVLKLTIPGQGGASTQSLRSPIASYEVTLDGPTTKTQTFPNNGTPIAMEVQEGTWNVSITAIDVRNIRAYSGYSQNIAVAAGAVTDVSINLNPKPAIVTINVDTSALFGAGYVPGTISVYAGGFVCSYYNDLSVSSSAPTASVTTEIGAPGTCDFTFTAKTGSGGVIAQKVLSNYQLWPGESITVTWIANTPTAASGTVSVSGTVAAPIDPPTNFTAAWNTTTDQLDMGWTAPGDVPTDAWYVLEYQTDPRYPFQATWSYGNVTTATQDVPDEWRGKTVKLRLLVYGYEGGNYGVWRSSVSTAPISVSIPAAP